MRNTTRAAVISNRRITGLTADVIGELVAEVGPLWQELHQARLVSRPRKQAVGAGAKHRLVFIGRLLATLVHLRHGTTHDLGVAVGIGEFLQEERRRQEENEVAGGSVDVLPCVP
ncbi:hypothetical protein OG895_42355 [Streptomyces sp. NBC_00201]|uniref:hypothetical protein n=1 Tax=unclassified Streptomyces TaxID=2593676 RepID=UPI00224D7962|nr:MULTISPECIES: hypothetical protein [unclassified Streptomyces]MCX5251722.1 hypothetical protein [Streptomyces sp. NBC_00201]